MSYCHALLSKKRQLDALSEEHALSLQSILHSEYLRSLRTGSDLQLLCVRCWSQSNKARLLALMARQASECDMLGLLDNAIAVLVMPKLALRLATHTALSLVAQLQEQALTPYSCVLVTVPMPTLLTCAQDFSVLLPKLKQSLQSYPPQDDLAFLVLEEPGALHSTMVSSAEKMFLFGAC